MNEKMNIPADDLVEIREKDAPVRLDIAYAREDNLLFGERIYHPDAKMWLHKILADIVLCAADVAAAQDLRLVLYDGLRTIEAQARMLETRVVRDNPQWLEAPRLLSPPGSGAHPRGMAIDCSLETLDGHLLDMGTPFDFLAADPSAAVNPAHRDFGGHSTEILANRALLDHALLEGAAACNCELFLLPQEWWDFRLPNAIYEGYAPLSDQDLPAGMRMVG